MRILGLLILMVLGVYGFEFPENHNWNLEFSKVNGEQLMINSIDAGLFSKDIDEETYCRYTYSQPRKMQYMLCYTTISNYSKRNTAKKYYFYINFGTNQKPVCTEGYDITTKTTRFNYELYKDNDKKTKYLGELRFNKFANLGVLPFEDGIKKKYFRIKNDKCDFKLNFDKVQIMDHDPMY